MSEVSIVKLPWCDLSMDLADDKSKLVQVIAWQWQQAITWSSVDPVPYHHMASLGHNDLTPWDQDKNWLSFCRHFQYIFLNKNHLIFIWISLEFIHYGPIGSMLTRVQEIAWHWTGNKPLPDTMITEITDTLWHHQVLTLDVRGPSYLGLTRSIS